MKRIDAYNVFKGKSSSSIIPPQISMRYTTEDEEIVQLVDTSSSLDQPGLLSGNTEGTSDTVALTEGTPVFEKKGKESPVASKRVPKRSSSLEDQSGETWRFLSDIKGRITKTVEEKIEEIKSDRIRKKKKSKLVSGGENSSISDSEEKSEASSSQQSPLKSESIKESDEETSDVSTQSYGRNDTLEQTEVDISESTTPVKEQPMAFRKHDKPRRPKRRKDKRGSIEIAEEVFEEEISSPKTRSYFQFSLFVELLKVWWPHSLPVLLALFWFCIPLPTEVLWAGIGAFAVIEIRFLLSLKGFTDTDLKSQESPLFTKGEPDHFNYSFLQNNINETNPEYSVYEGWMNELESEYNVEKYRVSLTESVHIRLEGSKLILSTPSQKVPKRAFWSEPDYSKEFKRERKYNLFGCNAMLLPVGLTRKRLWSKKYPIYVELISNAYLGFSVKDKSGGGDSSPLLPPVTRSQSDPQLDKSVIGNKPAIHHSNMELTSDVMTSNKDQEESSSKLVIDPLDDAKIVDGEDCKSLVKEDDEDAEFMSDFVRVSSLPSLTGKKSGLCLFARSDRDKEIWFRRLIAATSYSYCEGVVSDEEAFISQAYYEIRLLRTSRNTLYLNFMNNFSHISPSHPRKSKWRNKGYISGGMWFNVFLSRILYDTLNDVYWVSLLQEKLQRKLATVKLPSLIEELVLSKLEVSGPGPIVETWTEPKMDTEGIWTDLDISYKGQMSMTIDIRLNLVKKKTPSEIELTSVDTTQVKKPVSLSESKSAAYNSSLEDSGESSSDESDKPKLLDNLISPASPQRHRNVVDRIASSKYFLQVADNKYVKRALEGVSNTHISLIVDVKGLVGTVVLNIPPPPSDRLWYGFRPKPKLWLSARPVLGDRVLSVVNLTNWIEKKLYQEFEKVLVMPNMDDLVIPIMCKDLPF